MSKQPSPEIGKLIVTRRAQILGRALAILRGLGRRTSAMSRRQALVAARKLIENEADWLQDTYHARTADGTPCAPDHPDAARFDALGAVFHVAKFNPEGRRYEQGSVKGVHELIDAAIFFGGPWNPIDFNDQSTHPEVLVWFDKAIELAKD